VRLAEQVLPAGRLGRRLHHHSGRLSAAADLTDWCRGPGTHAVPARSRNIALVTVPTARAIELLRQESAGTNAILHVTC